MAVTVLLSSHWHTLHNDVFPVSLHEDTSSGMAYCDREAFVRVLISAVRQHSGNILSSLSLYINADA